MDARRPGVRSPRRARDQPGLTGLPDDDGEHVHDGPGRGPNRFRSSAGPIPAFVRSRIHRMVRPVTPAVRVAAARSTGGSGTRLSVRVRVRRRKLRLAESRPVHHHLQILSDGGGLQRLLSRLRARLQSRPADAGRLGNPRGTGRVGGPGVRPRQLLHSCPSLELPRTLAVSILALDSDC